MNSSAVVIDNKYDYDHYYPAFQGIVCSKWLTTEKLTQIQFQSNENTKHLVNMESDGQPMQLSQKRGCIMKSTPTSQQLGCNILHHLNFPCCFQM